MTKIKIVSKPEKKTSSKGTTYYGLKVKAEDGSEKSGNLFTDTEPQLDQELEVEEKYSEQYKNYSWYEKKEKKGGFGGGFKPSLTIDQQIRVVALQEAVLYLTSPMAPEIARNMKVKDLAHSFEEYIRNGKGGQ